MNLRTFAEALDAAFAASLEAQREAFSRELQSFFAEQLPPKEKEEEEIVFSESSLESFSAESEEFVEDEDDAFCIRNDSESVSLHEVREKPAPVLKGKRPRRPSMRYQRYEPPAADVKGDREADRDADEVTAGRMTRSMSSEMRAALRLYGTRGVEAFLNHYWTKGQIGEFLVAIGANWGNGQQEMIVRLLTNPDVEIGKCRALNGKCVACQGVHPCTFYSEDLGGYLGSKCAQQCKKIAALGACFAQLASEEKANQHDKDWAQSAWEEIHRCKTDIVTAHANKGNNLTKERAKRSRN